jgi:hypothetical protein
MKRRLTPGARVVTCLAVMIVLGTRADRAAASGTIEDPDAFRLFFGLPVLALVGGGSAAVAMVNLEQDSFRSGARPALGLGLGALNLGLAAGYVGAMMNGAGPSTMALVIGHGVTGALGLAASIRLFTLKREGQMALAPVPLAADEGVIPGLGLVARW